MSDNSLQEYRGEEGYYFPEIAEELNKYISSLEYGPAIERLKTNEEETSGYTA